ncbi:MAG: hypothetical protein PVI56_09715 [Gammaproteobacteria bacterium]|jgi:hypothetical protein
MKDTDLKDEVFKRMSDVKQPPTEAEALDIAERTARQHAEGVQRLEEVAAMLRKLAESHPDPDAGKQANLAIEKLDSARSSFALAAVNHNQVWNNDSNA